MAKLSKRPRQFVESIDLASIGQKVLDKPQETRRSDERAHFRTLFTFSERSHTTILLVGLFTAVLRGLAAPAAAFVTGRIFGDITAYSTNIISGTELLKSVTHWSEILIVVGFGRLVIQSVFFASWAAYGELQARCARRKLYSHLLLHDMKWFETLEDGTNALLLRMNAQVKDLQQATSQPLGSVFAIIANALFSLILALYISWKLTFVIMASLPISVTFMMFTNRHAGRYGQMQNEKKTMAVKSFNWMVSAIDSVKCNNAQTFEAMKYTEYVRNVVPWFNKTVNINAQHQGFAQFVATIMFVQAFYYGGILVRSGEKSPGDVITAFLSAVAIFTSFNTISSQMLLLELGRIAGANLQGLMQEDGDDGPDPLFLGVRDITAFEHLSGSTIRLDRVNFAYPSNPERPILRDLSIEIPRGRISFIVGRSGSGKSTIAQLLAHLYDRQCGGSVTIDGLSVETFSKPKLRRVAFLTEQHSFLFNDSIRKNIELGSIDDRPVSNERMDRAITLALLRRETLDGLDVDAVRVGRGGESISGGQRQRVALARAFLRNPEILVLDESTSALDRVTRGLIMDAIRNHRAGRTTIMITHDLELIRGNDYTYVIEDGRLVAEGCKSNIPQLNDRRWPYEGAIRPVSPATPSRDEVAFAMKYSEKHPALRPKWIPPIKEPNGRETQANIVIEGSSAPSIRPFAIAPTSTSQGSLRDGLSSVPWLQDRSSALQLDAADSLVFPLPVTPRRTLAPTNSRNQELVENLTPPSSGRGSAVKRASAALSDLVNRAGLEAQQLREHLHAHERRRWSVQLHDLPQAAQDTMSPHPYDSTSLITILRTVWPSLSRRHRALMAIALLLCMVHGAASPVLSLITTRLLGTYSFGRSTTTTARTYALVIVALAILDGCVQYAQQRIWESVAQSWIDALRAEAARLVLEQPKTFFSNEANAPARLAETMDRHADLARNIVGRMIPLYTIIGTVLAISAIWATATEWRVSLVTVAFLPVIVVMAQLLSVVSRKWDKETNDAAAEVNAFVLETFAGVRTIKLLTAEEKFERRLATISRHALFTGLKRAIAVGSLSGTTEAVQTCAQAGIFYYAAKLVAAGASVPNTILVLLMLVMTFAQVSMILAAVPQASMARDSAARFLRLVRLPGESHEDNGSAELAIVGSITFDDVSFAYPSSPGFKVLRKLSLSIHEGEYVAIVGPTGCGKSTVANLLMRLYSLKGYLNTGDITVSGSSISSYSVKSIRARFALVQQSTPPMPGTVRDNIAYGMPAVSDAHVRKAAKRAGIAEFIASLPEGYETVIGDGGQGLSGGQQQRIAIARALLRDPEVVILDEATSAMDRGSTDWFKDQIRQLAMERRKHGRRLTVLAITHDRRMMEGADRVVVMNSGQVVEEGSFQTLLADRGALWKLLNGGIWRGDGDGS